jgi:hypothetical protein
LFVVPVLLLFLGLAACPRSVVTPETNVERLEAERTLKDLIAYLDGDAYASAITWDEHVILAYQAAQGREPTATEFVALSTQHEGAHLERSEVLALALRDGRDRLGWDDTIRASESIGIADFQPSAETRAVAKSFGVDAIQFVAAELAADTAAWADVGEASKGGPALRGAPDVEYQTYFGFLHAHTELSDGRGEAMEAYVHARDQGGMDFFSLSDHAEYLNLWPWSTRWEEIQAAANATHDPGTYVTLWGFEWSNPVLGHISVFNTEGMADTITTFRLRSFYRWLSRQEDAFAHFNHPGDYDYIGHELRRFKLFESVLEPMIGLENWNGPRSFDKYYYNGSWDSDASFFDVALQQGWDIGALGSEDNHRREWGTRTQFRTGVLATDLTRAALMEAYMQRRFYATEDKDLHLDFRCSGYPMGARVSGVERSFTVRAEDAGGDTFQRIRLYRNGVMIDSRAVSGNPVSETFTDPSADGDDYYYVFVTQNDDNDHNGRNDEALSSPIWCVQ